MAERSLRFDLIGRDKSFSKTLDAAGRKGQKLNREFTRTLGGAGDTAGRQFGFRLNKRLGGGFSASTRIARNAAGAIGGAFVAAGIAKFGADSVKAAATFDKTMRQVATVAKLPARQIANLRDIALDMGAKTSFSASQASEAMLELAKGGLSVAEIKAGGLQHTLTLAAAGGLELGEAANLTIKSLGQFGLKANRAADVAAALAGGANASTASVADLGEALSQVGPGARNAGLSLQETTAVLAAFSDNGIRGSDAGTSLKTMLVSLVPSTDKAARTMRKLGLDFTDAHGAILPVTQIAQQLQDRLGKLSQAQRIAALQTIFGSDATRAATVLMQEGAAGLAKYIKATNDRGAAEALAKSNTEGAAGAFERLKGSIETIQIVIGTALLPKLADAANWLAKKLPEALATLQEKLRIASEWWDNNKESISALGRALNTIFIPAANSAATSTDTLKTSTETLTDSLDSLLEGILKGTQAFIAFARLAGNVSLRILDLISFAGQAINVFDKLSGGTGRAGQKMVDWARDMKDKTRVQLGALSQDARDTQRAIDRLHGKNIRITASPTFQFSKSFTRVDWLSARLAAGRMAEGGMVPGGYGGGDRVPILAEPGEAVVDKVRTRRYADILAMMGVPGFAGGGLIDKLSETGRSHTGVANLMGGWTKRLLDKALAKLLAGNPAIRAFIHSVDPLPYIWGAAGPGGYDCSGLVSAIYGKHTRKGGGQGQRYFTTATIGTGVPGLRSGLGGIFQIGVTPGRGHMAARYAGLGAEAESTRTGIKIGGAASRPESFARHFHMAKGGLVGGSLLTGLARDLGVDLGGDTGRIRINGRVMDGGGYLAPGWNPPMYNGTGRHEPVGLDVDHLAKAIARELAKVIPTRVAVDDIHTALQHKRGRYGGMSLGIS
jgi:TP901 family phage tail tape measure protein